MALQVFPSATSKSWDPCHETQKRRRQQDLQIARKQLHSISYLNKKIIDNHYQGWSTPFFVISLTGWCSLALAKPHEQFGFRMNLFGHRKGFRMIKKLFGFFTFTESHRIFGGSAILPKYHLRRIQEFLRTNKLNDVSKVEYWGFNTNRASCCRNAPLCFVFFVNWPGVNSSQPPNWPVLPFRAPKFF